MEIKNNKKIVVTGKTICMVAECFSAICALYWFIKALAFNDTNFPAIVSSCAIALFLTYYCGKR